LVGGLGEDESGHASSLKEVGKFKGRVTIYNEQDREATETLKAAHFAEIEGALKALHLKKTGRPLALDARKLGTNEEKHQFKKALTLMGA